MPDFIGGPSQKATFQELKTRLTEAPVLALPNEDDPFILDADASDAAVGVVLSQLQNGWKGPLPMPLGVIMTLSPATAPLVESFWW